MMQADFIPRHTHLDSPIHRAPAAAKLAFALLLVILTVVLPSESAPVLAPLAVLLALLAALSRIPLGFLARRMLWMEPFVLGATVLALFQPDGWTVFMLLVAKSSLCLLTMVLLSHTTPFSELLRVLRRARVPALLLTTLALMYRYLFVLLDETQRMRRARASRTFSRQRRATWRSAASVIGHLFIRASERAERIYAAMCARGWP